ncbi:hypothetical protein CHUAL_003687 [Chamberlinius hualienensis]
MGLYRKRDYTEGECFVVNAHFNPLGIDDGEETFLKTKSTATSEITLSLNSCQSGERAGFADDKYPLKVLLPPEPCGELECDEKSSNQWDSTKCVNNQAEDKTSKNNNRMKDDNGIQGFECDVSVEADFSGKQKREFVFTLYDLDGNGHITKDDITGLVRSMYEALGSSLKLPPSGSRTIRVRLTMSPGKKSKEKSPSKKSAEVDDEPRIAANEETNENVGDEDDDDDDGEDDEEGETEDDDMKISHQHHKQYLNKCTRKSSHHRKKRRDATATLNSRPTAVLRSSLKPQFISHHSQNRSTQGHHRSTSPCGRRRTRVSFSKEQQLLEIIQSNLDTKKGCGQCQGQIQRKRSSNADGTPRQHHVRRLKSDCNRCECVVDSDQLDNGRLCPYFITNSNIGCTKVVNDGYHCSKSTRSHYQLHHNRSYSHDVADYHHHNSTAAVVDDNLNHLRVEDILLKDVRAVNEKLDWFGHFISQKKNSGLYQGHHHHLRSKSHDPQPQFCCNNKISCNLMTFNPSCKLKLDSGFGYFSSHHHKHRHREEDHQRAMEQVACWIEKEHSGLKGSFTSPTLSDQQQQPPLNSQQSSHQQPSQSDNNAETDVKKTFSVPVVEKHEHHHIHQHYHHHYHHYHQL